MPPPPALCGLPAWLWSHWPVSPVCGLEPASGPALRVARPVHLSPGARLGPDQPLLSAPWAAFRPVLLFTLTEPPTLLVKYHFQQNTSHPMWLMIQKGFSRVGSKTQAMT